MSVLKPLLYLCLAILLASPVESMAMNVTATINYREPTEACRQDFVLPEVHTLPMGVGDAPVARCFNNGFATLPPHEEKIGVCYIATEPYRSWDPDGQDAIRIVRRKYHCRFLGQGAVLGQSKGLRESGSQVYFRGEEPRNYETKDPSCEVIVEELRKNNPDYHLIKGESL